MGSGRIPSRALGLITGLVGLGTVLLGLLATSPGRAEPPRTTTLRTSSGQPQQPPAQDSNLAAGYSQDRTAERGLRIAIGGEAGWRYMFWGQERIPRTDGAFTHGFHGALRLEVGGPRGGFYSYARFDGFAPSGLGTFPFSTQLRVGYFRNVHYFDVGGPRETTTRSYTGSSCDGTYCYDHYQTRTHRWWEPAGWVNGLRYGYLGGRMVYGTERQRDDTATEIAWAASLGIGFIEHKFTTWFVETELLYYFNDWREDDRSHWGWYFRGGALLGPVFLDVTVLLDPALGGEASLGLGVWLGS